MGLTSHKVLVLAAFFAVVAMAGTVWVWPRLARQDWKAVLGRIGLLLATQLAVLCALALLANDYFAFYSSWKDLLGSTDGTVTVQTKPGTKGHGEAAQPGQAQSVEVLGHEPVQGGGAIGREPAKSGRIDTVRIPGPGTGLSTEGYVYLPPQYFQPEYANKNFPAVIALTGFPGIAKNLITRLNYPGLALQEMQAGKMQPTILIMMQPSPAMPRDTECEDIPDGPQSDTYFAKDVPKVVESSYRVAADPHAWAVMGDSTGGYCALKLALRHPDAFQSAVSMSGYYVAANDPTTGDLFGGSQQRKNEADLNWRLKNLPQPPVALMLAGPLSGDGNYKKETDAFQGLVQGPTTVSTATVPEGGHNFETWSKLMPPSFDWLSEHLKAPTS